MDDSTRLEKAILAIQRLNKKIEELSQPVAITGMSCVFPGAENLDAFWSLLKNGKDGISDVPEDRWPKDDYYHPDTKVPGKIITDKGGFITNIDQFDASFFNISPREADNMDPQQRLLLVKTWEALEHAGIAPASLKRSDTGVFIGIATHDYFTLLNQNNGTEGVNAWLASGTAFSTASGRLSYTLGLQGPNMAIETACSSSMVALHEACQSLRRGECSLAIGGGVNIILSPELSIAFSKAGMLAADGHCKTFDARADGYVRGEGCGIVILKRLSDALRDKDNILAVIKATGINQDGASSGLTVPNGDAQESLLSKVLTDAGLEADDIDYLECHGTGTRLGDPIEVHAIGQVYGKNRSHPLKLGSVKTNIGHLEAAAGIAGVIKTVLALQKAELPGNLHFHQLNPHIALDFPATILAQQETWPRHGSSRYAAVSSFGFSGTNAHMILEEAPAINPVENTTNSEASLFVLSAKTNDSLMALITSYINYLENSTARLEDICYTAATGRAHFQHRIALVAKDKKDLLEQLKKGSFNSETSNRTNAQTEYLSGKRIDWVAQYKAREDNLRKVILPTYCFDNQRHWFDIQKRAWLPYGKVQHELLGAKWLGHGQELRFINQISSHKPTYLNDHHVFGHSIFPGAGFVESSMAAGIQAFGERPLHLSNINFLAPLRLQGNMAYESVLVTGDSLSYQGTIHAKQEDDSNWVQLVDFVVQTDFYPDASPIDLEAIKSSMTKVELGDLYSRLESMGLQYGPRFQSIQAGYSNSSYALVALENNAIDPHTCYLHPSLLDAAFQAIFVCLPGAAVSAYIPSRIQGLHWYKRATGLIWAVLELRHQDAQSLTADIRLYDDQGGCLAIIQGFHARSIERHAFETMLFRKEDADCYLECYESFTLPQVVANKDEPFVVYGDRKAELKTATDDGPVHVVFIYDSNFDLLLSVTKRLLMKKPLSFTLITQHAFAINESDMINPDHAKALGFWRSFRLEASHFPCYVLDVDKTDSAEELLALIRKGVIPEPQLIRRDQVYVPRLLTLAEALNRQQRLPAPEPQMYLTSETGIDSLDWADRQPVPLADDDIRIRILATALNFRDVLKAMNLYPGDAGDFGYECTGMVLETGSAVHLIRPGDVVVAMRDGLFGGEAIVKDYQAVVLPACLNPVQGASIPIVFLTAHYALNTVAKLKKGQKILIHAAAGGVGLAAIAIAESIGAEVYATCSTTKQDWLKEHRGVKHIYDSRSLDFSRKIMVDSEGVDVVLNSLTGDGFIEASLACLKSGGSFLEISKLNVYSNDQMTRVRPDVTYQLIEIDKRMRDEPLAVHDELMKIMSLFDDKKLQPLPVTEYPVGDAVAAFHYLQQAKHIGKVVLSNPVPFKFKPESTYLISGGIGGLGLELAKHLIDKGVRHLALLSRHLPGESVTQWMVEQRNSGVVINHYPVDVADKNALQTVFDDISGSGHPLKGIFHAAGVIKDGFLVHAGQQDFDEVLAPKIQGSMNLDSLGEDLDCFVLFSSVAAVLGNAGQSNYSAANAFMDALAFQRHQRGLTALSINWGPFAKTGMATHLEAFHRAQGILPLDTKHAFERLDHLLTGSDCRVVCMLLNRETFNLDDPYLAYLNSKITTDKGEWLAMLGSLPVEQREQSLIKNILPLLARVLNIDKLDSIDINKGFFELGMDSLMAVEFKNAIQTKLGNATRLQSSIIFDFPNTRALSKAIINLLKGQMDFSDPAQQTDSGPDGEVDIQFVKSLSDVDIDKFINDES